VIPLAQPLRANIVVVAAVVTCAAIWKILVGEENRNS
jgi:hypothetical protein